MDESEKMVALKKAYAEVILNTAKEAAARVIASERRAVRFQHDLNATKEESLRLLLRLRQMIDSEATSLNDLQDDQDVDYNSRIHTSEAEVTCINQRRRIEELEAKLGKTEDKILELRAELKNTTDELDTQKKNEMQLHDSCNIKSAEIAVPSEDKTPQTIVPYSSDSDPEPSEKTDKGYHGLIKEAKKSSFSHLESYLSHGSDVASAEMSRNGCTQRVRALKDEGRVRVKKRKRSMTRKKRSLSGKKTKMATKVEVQELPDVSSLKKRRQEQDSNTVTVPKTPDNGMADVSGQKPLVAKESRVLRYTSRRMRKKETTSGCCDERDESLKDSKESGSIEECSRDSRRLAQVARQLISLSGRKW